MSNKLAQIFIQRQSVIRFQTSIFFFFNLSCKTQLYYKHTPRTCRNFIELSRRNYYDNVKFHRIIKVPLSCTIVLVLYLFCFVEECKCLHRYGFIFGIGFYGARWGSHWNRKRWRIHIWVNFFFFFLGISIFYDKFVSGKLFSKLVLVYSKMITIKP